jgi:hypothetical protein
LPRTFCGMCASGLHACGGVGGAGEASAGQRCDSLDQRRALTRSGASPARLARLISIGCLTCTRPFTSSSRGGSGAQPLALRPSSGWCAFAVLARKSAPVPAFGALRNHPRCASSPRALQRPVCVAPLSDQPLPTPKACMDAWPHTTRHVPLPEGVKVLLAGPPREWYGRV